MDANGLRFWLLADAAHWPARAHTAWHAECGTLRLASERRLTAPVDLNGVRRGQHRARSDPACGRHPRRGCPMERQRRRHRRAQPPAWRRTAAAAARGPDAISASDRTACCMWRSPIGCTCTTCGAAGPTRRCGSRDSRPGGIEADSGGVWVLERAGRLARLTGVPMPFTTPARDDYAPGVFRPDPENCCPPAMRLLDAVSWPAGERPIALAAHPDRGLALLSWFGDGEPRLRRLDAGDRPAHGTARTRRCTLCLRAGVARRRPRRRAHARAARRAGLRRD